MEENGTNFQKPSWEKLGSLTGFIVEFLASILNDSSVGYWLRHKSELKKKLREAFSAKDASDVWSEERSKIIIFYETCFGGKWIPRLDEISFPQPTPSLNHPEFIFSSMTEQEAFDAYAKYFGRDNVWEALNGINQKIDRSSIQKRPNRDYAIFHAGGREPDLLNYSYNDAIKKNIVFMTPLEGIISAFRYRFETKEMWDVVGITKLSAIACDNYAIGMYGSKSGKYHMATYSRVVRQLTDGVREVVY